MRDQKRLNRGLDLSEVKKEKYGLSKKTFNFDEDQLKNIKQMLGSHNEVSGQDRQYKSFASSYKITQNPVQFNGTVNYATKS